jgi:hypothetical protein
MWRALSYTHHDVCCTWRAVCAPRHLLPRACMCMVLVELACSVQPDICCHLARMYCHPSQVLADINRRFQHSRPSSSLQTAGRPNTALAHGVGIVPHRSPMLSRACAPTASRSPTQRASTPRCVACVSVPFMMGHAGLLVHMFDNLEDPQQAWHVCAHGWCAGWVDHFSCAPPYERTPARMRLLACSCGCSHAHADAHAALTHGCSPTHAALIHSTPQAASAATQLHYLSPSHTHSTSHTS